MDITEQLKAQMRIYSQFNDDHIGILRSVLKGAINEIVALRAEVKKLKQPVRESTEKM